MKPPSAKHAPTLFLRAVLALIALGVIAFCVFALPSIWQGGSAEFPMASMSVQLIVIGLYITVVPFFIALWQTFKLLHYIDHNVAFSAASVSALRIIKFCAIVVAAIYTAFVPLLYPIAEADDAPGLILVGVGIACAPVAFAVFAAVLQKLVQNAVDMKSEHDLTV